MRITEKPNREIIERLITIANNFDPNKDESKKDSYFLTYPHFLNYFKSLQRINVENLIIGISFTYSWMPTVLKSIKEAYLEKSVSILNDAKNGKKLNEKDLSILKQTLNNSLVGTSKLLHFINPYQYAIWDSRVFRFLNNEEPHKYKIEKPKAYIEYIEFIGNLKTESSFEFFHKLMAQKVGYEISEYRAAELAFFIGKKS